LSQAPQARGVRLACRRKPAEWLFPGNRWHTANHPIDTKVPWQACQAAAQRAGIQKEVHPHWVEHAERNAIYAAARCGISLEGCSMYVELMPCVDCARGIIQAGLWEVVVSKERMQGYSSPTYREQHVVAASLLKEAGVILRTA
jgi:deoxycytidylate deaminase